MLAWAIFAREAILLKSGTGRSIWGRRSWLARRQVLRCYRQPHLAIGLRVHRGALGHAGRPTEEALNLIWLPGARVVGLPVQ